MLRKASFTAKYATFIFALLTALVVTSGCVPHRLLELTNTLDEPIDVFSYSDTKSNYDITGDSIEHLKSIGIGDRNYLNCPTYCLVEPNETGFGEYVVRRPDVIVSARTRETLEVVYHRVFSWKELKAVDFSVDIVDMREPGTHLTDKPMTDRTATLLCQDCEDIDLHTGPQYDGESGSSGRSIYYVPFTSTYTWNRLRSYGARFPEFGEKCFQPGRYLESVFQFDEQITDGLMRAETVPGADDGSGYPAIYLFTISGKSIDEILIRNGVAYASGEHGQHWEHLKAVEDETRTKGVGCLWS